MKRRGFIGSIGAAALAGKTMAAKKAKPNFIIIFMDDMGYADVGCFGAKGYATPNMDRMAAEGLKMTNFYAAACVCTPSRAALMTGCYPERVGGLGVLFPDRDKGLSWKGINPEETTMAEMLKGVGYKTAIVGKWHLGDKKMFLPLQHGFDEYFGLPYSNDMREGRNGMPPLPLIEGNETIEDEPDQSLLTKRYTERAVKIIKENKDRPFFLYLPHTMPHTPLYVSKAFAGKTKRGLFGDVLEELDWSVGQVLKALKDNGIDDNTLVILTSDNGPWLTMNENGGSALPLRAGKMTRYEGGQREVCIIRWPGRIQAGRTSAELASTIDLLPTIGKIAGATLPKKKLDGLDISSVLFSPSAKSPRDTFFFGKTIVRHGKWKLFRPGSYAEINKDASGKNKKTNAKYGTARLFDLENDISETTDAAKQHPEIVERLEKLLVAHNADLDANSREPGTLPNYTPPKPQKKEKKGAKKKKK
ncbi:MAG: sulfatase [Kiritimatiellales bacterium]|nr:sulfatase [Kiritimatiellales bacterium]